MPRCIHCIAASLLAAVVCLVGDIAVTASSQRRADDPRHNAPVASLHRMMQTVNAGDAAGYARLYAPQAVITIYGGGEIKGRAAIENYEVDLLREFPGARLAFYDAWQKPLRAVIHYGVNGRTPGGQSMGHEGLLFFRFDDAGLITEEHRYLDSLTPMAQLGALGKLTARAIPTLPAEMAVHVATASSAPRRTIELASASFAPFEAQNAATLRAALADHVVIDELMLPRAFADKASAPQWIDLWTTAVADPQVEVTTMIVVGEFVLAELVVRGRVTGRFGFVSASDKPFVVHRGMVAQVTDGKLSRISAFMNGKELAEAVGQWPPVRSGR